MSALPKPKTDFIPWLLPIVVAAIALPLIGSGSTWVTLTVAGLAMGMMIFLMASGLTLVFGLMDVLNFGHGAFISVGAYVAVAVLAPLTGLVQSPLIGDNLLAILAAIIAAALVSGGLGWAFERYMVRPVYGQHLKQILITMGGFIVVEQALHAIFGPTQIPLPLPQGFRGAIMLGDSAIEKYRVAAIILGLAVFAVMVTVLTKTKLGLLIRAGVENAEMVEALGYRIRRLFVGVFVAGSGLAGLGGVMWALYREQVTAQMGMEVMVLVFICIIIGGLGSVAGCFIGAVMVALLANYTGFLVPKVALISNILLMVVILLWRPQGLYAVAKRG
ncbi:branched-chain amino acid ABC transporter permease [Lacibacterium aquatile]|uniref:Branched-chain amino acid ABC transporter permease n=1 Tax=Lacibacterium aquatile TaxID=1168082 RepID=A0ABW5DV12_9PROT